MKRESITQKMLENLRRVAPVSTPGQTPQRPRTVTLYG